MFSYRNDEDFPSVYDGYCVRYQIDLIPTDGDYTSMIGRLMNPDPTLFTANPEFCYNMWKSIAQQEVLEYLTYSIEKVRFEFSPKEKTYVVIDDLLEHYSVSQIYGVIYRSVAYSAKYAAENRLSKVHSGNLVINHCQRYGEKAKAERWDLKKFGRDFDCEQTIISELFYDRILNIGALGFDNVPTKIL